MVEVFKVQRNAGYVLIDHRGKPCYDKKFILSSNGGFEGQRHKLVLAEEGDKVTSTNLLGDLSELGDQAVTLKLVGKEWKNIAPAAPAAPPAPAAPAAKAPTISPLDAMGK